MQLLAVVEENYCKCCACLSPAGHKLVHGSFVHKLSHLKLCASSV